MYQNIYGNGVLNLDRKRELRLKYKEMRPQMGVFTIRSKTTNKCYIEAAKDLKSVMNSTKFKLGAGNHPNFELQKIWNDLGSEDFTIEILENLEYDKDDSKTDYTEDLTLLKLIWEEKLTKENFELI